jgi:hypothetical protein
MLFDRLEDPAASLSFSGVLLEPGRVADVVDRLLDRPRPVVTVPRWRGAEARLFAQAPRLAMWSAPHVVRLSRWQQKMAARRLRKAGRA